MVTTFVKQGLAQFADNLRMSVQILGFDHDFWFEEREARGLGPPEAGPLPLGEDGLLYYVCFREPGDSIVHDPRVDSEAFATAAQAVAEAEHLSDGRITWDA